MKNEIIEVSAKALIRITSAITLVSVQSCITVPPLANADHSGILLEFATPYRKPQTKSTTRKVWRYSHADFDRAAELLDSIDWDS